MSQDENFYNTGMGTTPGMWQMVSELLDKEKLPASVNNAIYKLCEGRAFVKELPEN